MRTLTKTTICIGHREILRVLTITVFSIVVCLSNSPQTAVGQAYDIDNSHSSVIFAVSHFGLSYTYGRFNQVSGSFELANGEPTDAGFSFAIDTNSLDTNNGDRDTHLKGPEFFNTEQFPELKFTTTAFKKVGAEYQITGDLQMLGQTKSIVMPVQMVGVGPGPFGKQRAGFFTKFTIKRSDFGMDKMLDSIGDKVSITFSFEGIQK